MDINVWANKILIDFLFESGRIVKQVIGISSGAAVNGSRGWNAYALSKAALNMLIDLYAKEQENTHFTALAPGIINTGMQEYIRSLPDPEKFPVVEKLTKLYRENKMDEAEESARKWQRHLIKCKDLPSGSFTDIREMTSK